MTDNEKQRGILLPTDEHGNYILDDSDVMTAPTPEEIAALYKEMVASGEIEPAPDAQ